jgi:hypothetical protein
MLLLSSSLPSGTCRALFPATSSDAIYDRTIVIPEFVAIDNRSHEYINDNHVPTVKGYNWKNTQKLPFENKLTFQCLVLNVVISKN